jgi:hypothetical protein
MVSPTTESSMESPSQPQALYVLPAHRCVASWAELSFPLSFFTIIYHKREGKAAHSYFSLAPSTYNKVPPDPFLRKGRETGCPELQGKRNKTVNYGWSLLNKCNLVKFGKIFTFAYICNFTAELLVFLTYATLKCIRNPLVCYIQHPFLIYNTQFRGEKTQLNLI